MADETKTPKTPGVVPYILTPSCDKHIEWLKEVFAARVVELFRTKDGSKVMHASMVVNDGIFFLSDNTCAVDGKELLPQDYNVEDTHGFWLHIEVEDPNPLWQKAMANGCTVVVDLQTQYYGGELGCFRDPFGFSWGVAKAGDCRRSGVIPYLFLPDGDCEKHIEWMEKAFGAKNTHIYRGDNNIVLHCTMEINGAPLYISDLSGMPGTVEALSVLSGKTNRFFCHMDVKDPFGLWEVLKKAGAEVIMELKMQFSGNNYGKVKDPFGFEWSVCGTKPEPIHTSPNGVIPYLLSPDCEKHIDWIKNVFDGEVVSLIHTEDKKKVMHSSLKINKGSVYMCDAVSTALKDPPKGEPSGYVCHMHMPDPDTTWKKAMANGATQTVELKIQFWGSYYGSFKDPYGFEWAVMKI